MIPSLEIMDDLTQWFQVDIKHLHYIDISPDELIQKPRKKDTMDRC